MRLIPLVLAALVAIAHAGTVRFDQIIMKCLFIDILLDSKLVPQGKKEKAEIATYYCSRD